MKDKFAELAAVPAPGQCSNVKLTRQRITMAPARAKTASVVLRPAHTPSELSCAANTERQLQLG